MRPNAVNISSSFIYNENTSKQTGLSIWILTCSHFTSQIPDQFYGRITRTSSRSSCLLIFVTYRFTSFLQGRRNSISSTSILFNFEFRAWCLQSLGPVNTPWKRGFSVPPKTCGHVTPGRKREQTSCSTKVFGPLLQERNFFKSVGSPPSFSKSTYSLRSILCLDKLPSISSWRLAVISSPLQVQLSTPVHSLFTPKIFSPCGLSTL